jgi:predicted nucleic acid-binding protein
VSSTVIDASVLAKLVYHEPGSAQARRLVKELAARSAPLHAPDLLFAEIAHIGLKKIRDGEATEREARALQDVTLRLPLAVWPSQLLAPTAAEISLASGASLYDSMYIAVAEHVDGMLLTADQRLLLVVAGTPLDRRVRVLGSS